MPLEADVVTIGVDHIITIAVKGQGDARNYKELSTHVRPGDRIQWVCKDGDVEIQFDNWPIAPPANGLKIKKGATNNWFAIAAMRRTTCKYTVIVTFPDGRRVERDPVIIVDDETP
jgi:hypothetical protein